MQEISQRLSRFVGKGGTQSMGTRRSFLKDSESSSIEAMDNVEHSLPVAPVLVGYSCRPFAALGCEQDLGSSQDKGIFGA